MKFKFLLIFGIITLILLSGCSEPQNQDSKLCSNEKGYTTEYSKSNNYISLTSESQLKLRAKLNETPGNLSEISDLICLEELHVNNQEIRTEYLTPILKLKNLKHLDLSNTKVEDLTQLTELTKLESLDLDDTRVSNLEPITQLLELKTLSISHTQILELAILKNMANYGDMTILITKDTQEECDYIFREYAETPNILCVTN